MGYAIEKKWKAGGLSLGWTAVPTVLFFIYTSNILYFRKINELFR